YTPASAPPRTPPRRPSSPPKTADPAVPMPALLPPAPVNPPGPLPQQMPGYDPAPVIAAQDLNLQDFLNLPVKEILARLGLPSSDIAKPPDGAPPPESQADAAPPAGNPIDPMALIS